MTILCYHAVEPGWESPLALHPDEFEAQCRWLARNRTVVPLDVAVERLDRHGRLPRGEVAITFDDGFAGLYEHALPTLRDQGLPATVFVVAQTLTDEGRQVDWVDTPPPWQLATLDVEQLREMETTGVTVASHSFAHHELPGLSPEECVADLRRSREVLEDLFGHPVPFLAYPRGQHDEQVRRAAREAGFSHGFALPESPEPTGPFSVPRVGLYPGNGVRGLRLKLSRWYLPLRTGPLYPVVRQLVKGAPPPSRRSG